MSRLSDILSAGLCDRLKIEKRQETGKVFRGTRISFHLLHCSDVSDAFILRRRICTNYKGLVIFSPSIALHLLF
jgi:hypothetical protein